MPLRTARSGRPEDARAEFFHDLRALRTRRGLKLVDIAERTRFSAATLADVESGPELPSLPALEAYLRGCGEPLSAWEDRWRQLDQGLAAVIADADGPPAGETAVIPVIGASPVIAAGPSPRRLPALWYTVAAGAVVLLAAGGVALLAWSHGAGGQRGHAVTAPRSTAAPAPGADSTSWRSATGGDGPGATPAPSARLRSTIVVPHPRAAAALMEVAGIGCPRGNVVVADAPTGPGWTASDGGWTGDDCDGSAVWTTDPNGNQPVPSALTWKFGLTAAVSHCTLAVFVPSRNALGVGQYAVFTDAVADIALVAVSQAAVAGQWVTLGSYPVRGTSLEIQVAPAAGTKGAPGPGAHGRNHVTGQGPGQNSAIAASAARAACA